jgi:hypothetical protein
MLWGVTRWFKIAVKIAKYTLPPAVVVGGWWLYQIINRDPGGTISGLAAVTSMRNLSHERTSPGGVRYSVDTALASYRLEMRPEDSHSQRVFASYGAALRYAREQQLPSIPSASLVLATCTATDFRLHAALELALDRDPNIGRSVLVREWLAAALGRRQEAPPEARPAYDRPHAIWPPPCSCRTMSPNCRRISSDQPWPSPPMIRRSDHGRRPRNSA